MNGVLAPIGFKAVPLGAPETNDVRDFIPLAETVAASERAGLSVGDYIDTVLNKIPGATQKTIDEMTRLGVFDCPIETVVEIGPGSGRYLERTIEACSPACYEIYETSADWGAYLAARFAIRVQPTDGNTLKATADGSADLVQAHKVFSTIPFLPTCSYWQEIARITKSGGFVVFDIMTEACLDRSTVDGWIASQANHGSYPAVMPRALAVDFFSSRGFDLAGSFIVPMGAGETEYFVFRKPGRP